MAEKKEHNVTQNPYRETGVEFTPDNRWLVFSSNRDRGVTHLFALPLERVKEDPDDPLVKARRKKEKKEKKAEDTGLKLQMDGIGRRALPLRGWRWRCSRVTSLNVRRRPPIPAGAGVSPLPLAPGPQEHGDDEQCEQPAHDREGDVARRRHEHARERAARMATNGQLDQGPRGRQLEW